MCKWGADDLSCDIIPSCVISNHFWWLEILEHNFCFAIFFIIQVFWFFYVLGLDSCIIISDSIFWITKSLVSCFCATTKLELLALRFFWFVCVLLCMGVWVSSKCYVVPFSFYTSWFFRSFAYATNIVHSQILVC
jgi:hypothetical protein